MAISSTRKFRPLTHPLKAHGHFRTAEILWQGHYVGDMIAQHVDRPLLCRCRPSGVGFWQGNGHHHCPLTVNGTLYQRQRQQAKNERKYCCSTNEFLCFFLSTNVINYHVIEKLHWNSPSAAVAGGGAHFIDVVAIELLPNSFGVCVCVERGWRRWLCVNVSLPKGKENKKN